MPITDQLASQVGSRTEAANRHVAQLCLRRPALLSEIIDGLRSDDAALVGDCAEVLTKVAEAQPELVAPHAARLARLLNHPTARVRWEAMHALALVAALAPAVVRQYHAAVAARLRDDASVIVRDHAVDVLGAYAGTSRAAALKTFPVLKEALGLHGGKHAARALNGLARAAQAAPTLAAEVRALAFHHLGAGRGVTRQAAKRVLKQLE